MAVWRWHRIKRNKKIKWFRIHIHIELTIPPQIECILKRHFVSFVSFVSAFSLCLNSVFCLNFETTTMVFSSNWLCAIAILLFAAVVQSQVQESTTKQPPTPPPFTANNQGTYNLKKKFLCSFLHCCCRWISGGVWISSTLYGMCSQTVLNIRNALAAHVSVVVIYLKTTTKNKTLEPVKNMR